MGIERQEDIGVVQDRFSIQLRTEQSVIETEVFPSVDDAKRRKRSEVWKKTGRSVFWTAVGGGAVGQGLAHIILSGYGAGDTQEAIAGVELIALGIILLNKSSRSLDAINLTKRQLERLQSTLSRSQEQTPPHS